jgi:hypothetical protein
MRCCEKYAIKTSGRNEVKDTPLALARFPILRFLAGRHTPRNGLSVRMSQCAGAQDHALRGIVNPNKQKSDRYDE